MKALQKLFWNPALIALALVLAAIALFTGGCEDKPNEQEGDKEPEQAQFQVSVGSGPVTLDETRRSATVTITGRCRGKDLPTPCGTVNWTVKRIIGAPPGVTARFVSGETTYSPTLQISVDWDKAIAAQSQNSLRAGAHEGRVIFNPNLQGAALYTKQLRPTGPLGVDVALILPNAPPDRQEQSADKPRLTVPLRRDFSLKKDGPPLVLTLPITYSGPPNTLTVTGPSMSGTQAGQKFTIVDGGGRNLPGDGTFVSPLLIQFDVATDDFNFYSATLDVSVNDARPVRVFLTGNRSRF